MSHEGLTRPYHETANDRFKRTMDPLMWIGVIVAAAIHFALFSFFPQLTAAELGLDPDETLIIQLPPELEIPPPPEEITRPALPVVADTELPDPVTIHKTTFPENPVEDLPVRIETRRDDERPRLTPYSVAPRLKNREEAIQIVERNYPRLLEEAGIGGTVVLWALIQADGRVADARVEKSSGHRALDQAALRSILLFDYVPALNLDQRVSVWVRQSVVFRVK